MPNQAPYATNAHGVQSKGLDFTDPRAPTTQVYHGFSIVVNNNVIGRINSWTPNVPNRPGVHLKELNHNTFGLPVDYVPGVAEGFTLALARAEVWNQELEVAFGFGASFETLIDQDRPFSIQEYLFRGRTQLYRLIEYSGCWFQNKDYDAWAADGDGVIRISSTIAYVRRRRLV